MLNFTLLKIANDQFTKKYFFLIPMADHFVKKVFLKPNTDTEPNLSEPLNTPQSILHTLTV
jgi:hypothetical protein